MVLFFQKENFGWDTSTTLPFKSKCIQLGLNNDPIILSQQGIKWSVGNQIQILKPGFDPTNTFYVFRQVYDTDGNPCEGVSAVEQSNYRSGCRQAYKRHQMLLLVGPIILDTLQV
jgi:iron complex outermembrane receptor protein